MPPGTLTALAVLAALAVIAGLAVVALTDPESAEPGPMAAAPGSPSLDPSSAVSPTPSAGPPTAAPPPDFLKTIGYGRAPTGFPADPAPQSTTRLAEGLHPTTKIPVYDAPGGRARAFIAPTISGVPLTMPIAERRLGWTAVLLPSTNRVIGWVPPGDWETVPLRDLIVVERRSHRLVWSRDDREIRSWRVTLGASATPTPLGRSFILGRSKLKSKVYADTEVFALGSVPDHPGNVPTALRGAHIGIHTWYNDNALGRNVSDGCIRLTRSGQRLLLAEVPAGTEVVVVDR